MKATQQDRTIQPPIAKRSYGWVVLVAAVLIFGGGLYFFLSNNKEQPVKTPKPANTPVENGTPLPDIPFINIDEPDFVLPILDESDGEFRTHLIGISDQLAPWLQFEELIRRGVTFNDGLSRGEVQTKLLSLPPPNGKFSATSQDNGLYLTKQNHQRYNVIKTLIEAIDPEKLAKLFHLFRPLLEQAYGELGYNATDLDASIIFTLNEILTTPVITEPIKLKLETVHYTFADQKLENLTALQKQLLRMGPETTQLLQDKALTLKQGLLNATTPGDSQQSP